MGARRRCSPCGSGHPSCVSALLTKPPPTCPVLPRSPRRLSGRPAHRPAPAGPLAGSPADGPPWGLQGPRPDRAHPGPCGGQGGLAGPRARARPPVGAEGALLAGGGAAAACRGDRPGVRGGRGCPLGAARSPLGLGHGLGAGRAGLPRGRAGSCGRAGAGRALRCHSASCGDPAPALRGAGPQRPPERRRKGPLWPWPEGLATGLHLGVHPTGEITGSARSCAVAVWGRGGGKSKTILTLLA